jgi:hypothetical protein
MSRFRRCRFGLLARSLPVVFLILMANIAGAQGVPSGGGLDLAPSNLVGMPGTTAGLPQGSNSLYLNSGMFRDILPLKGNLEFGYVYQFNENISTSRFTFDGLLPARTGHDGAAFGEFHGEFANFGNTLRSLITFGNTRISQRGFNDRIDLSFGGGYRKIFGESLLVGVNGFYDASRIGNRWYGSPGVGVEMAALGAGSDLIDLNFNYYGNLFQGRSSIINAFRNGPGNFDVEVGYSLELGAYGPDLRLKLTGYQFDVGSKVCGWNGGAEIKSRNGVFSVKAETGRDRINGTYYTVGGYANVGLQLENVLNGESPFTAPEPIFQSPRNLRRLLGLKVKRNWYAPATVVLSRMSKLGMAKPGMTLLFRGTNPTPRVWDMSGSGDGWSRPFLEGIVSMAVANSASLITVSFTITANTVDSPGRAGVRSTAFAIPVVWFTAPGTPMVPAGGAAVGTHLFLLAPGQFTSDVSNVGIDWHGDPSVNGTMNIQDFVVEFWK